MASTFTIDAQPAGRTVTGAKKVRIGSGNLGVYATNGVAYTKAQLELAVAVEDLRVDPAGGIIFEVDKTNSKVKAYRQKDPAAAGGADIALPEVANGVDITTVVFRFRAIGN